MGKYKIKNISGSLITINIINDDKKNEGIHLSPKELSRELSQEESNSKEILEHLKKKKKQIKLLEM